MQVLNADWYKGVCEETFFPSQLRNKEKELATQKPYKQTFIMQIPFNSGD